MGDPEPQPQRSARPGQLAKVGGRYRVQCGTRGCYRVMEWPGSTPLDRVRQALKLAGWSNAVSYAWRCPACHAAAAEAGMTKARELDARERREPGLFQTVVRAEVVAPSSGPFVVVVTGGRHYGGRPGEGELWWAALDAAHRRRPITLLREGGASGADTIAKRWAHARGVEVDTVDAEWKRYGPAAGPIRNAAMLAKEPRPHAVIAAPGGVGTADMVAKARAAGVPVWHAIKAKAEPAGLGSA